MPKKLSQVKYKAPRNKAAAKVYHETYGRLLAESHLLEQKAAQFGRLSALDRNNTTTKLPKREGYTVMQRRDMVRRALSLYDQNELVRPIINLVSSATFGDGRPDFRGKREDLTEFCLKLVDNNKLNFHDIAREAELAGDSFLWFKPDGDNTEIRSLDAGEVVSVLKDGDIRQLLGYAWMQNAGQGNAVSVAKPDFSIDRVEHLRFNSTTTSQYGRSSVRHIVYWIDVLDKLFEENWLRGAQYYGNPLLAVVGVPGPYQNQVKSEIESQVQRAGKSWVLPPETDIKSPSLSLDYPIGDIVGWVFRLISIATEIPITLLGSADAASRGSAFFANPRFLLAIKPRREVWRIGLRSFFIKIFKAEGLIKDGEVLTCKDFDIGFNQVFEKDLAEIADVINIAREKGVVSLETAREWLGLDASEEAEKIEKEPKPEMPETEDGEDDEMGDKEGVKDKEKAMDKKGKRNMKKKDDED